MTFTCLQWVFDHFFLHDQAYEWDSKLSRKRDVQGVFILRYPSSFVLSYRCTFLWFDHKVLNLMHLYLSSVTGKDSAIFTPLN